MMRLALALMALVLSGGCCSEAVSPAPPRPLRCLEHDYDCMSVALRETQDSIFVDIWVPATTRRDPRIDCNLGVVQVSSVTRTREPEGTLARARFDRDPIREIEAI